MVQHCLKYFHWGLLSFATSLISLFCIFGIKWSFEFEEHINTINAHAALIEIQWGIWSRFGCWTLEEIQTNLQQNTWLPWKIKKNQWKWSGAGNLKKIWCLISLEDVCADLNPEENCSFTSHQLQHSSRCILWMFQHMKPNMMHSTARQKYEQQLFPDRDA